MPNIKPVSDLRNYTEVLKDICVGSPVFLTKNGRGRYAIVDMEEYENMQAIIKLIVVIAMRQQSTGYRTACVVDWSHNKDKGAAYNGNARRNELC